MPVPHRARLSPPRSKAPRPFCGTALPAYSSSTSSPKDRARSFGELAEAIAKATAEGAFSLIGGGDSVACINKFGMADQVSYISTGGGALLEAIEGKELPGVAAICKK